MYKAGKVDGWDRPESPWLDTIEEARQWAYENLKGCDWAIWKKGMFNHDKVEQNY